MEATALNAAHIDVAFIHKWLDEERECLAARPERWIASDMGPKGFHKLDTASNICNNLRQYGGAAPCEHAQGHVWVLPCYFHELR